MTLHLQKLCVGAESFEDLDKWIKEQIATQKKRGSKKPEQTHTTRMMPSRGEEILDGGSLYWVIKGVMCARQEILELRPVTGKDGIARCQIVLKPKLIRTEPRPRRPFQGWRYLKADEAPGDMDRATAATGLPPHIVTELKELGLL
jgi:hypothetical protein